MLGDRDVEFSADSLSSPLGLTPAITKPSTHGKSAAYQLASRAIPAPKKTLAGSYRLQMNHCGITDANLSDFLEYGKDLSTATYAATEKGRQRAAELSLDATLPFPEVPVLELTVNRNTLTDTALPTIVNFIKSNPNIQAFEALGNALTDGCAPYLAQLAVECKLQRIKVGDNKITAAGVKIFADAIKSNESNLRQLHLSGNAILDEGVAAIVTACRQSEVEVFGLRDVGMTAEGWACVGEMLGTEESPVKELQLKGNPLPEECATALVSPLLSQGPAAMLGSLRVLSIPHCDITPGAALLLQQFLSRCPNLTTADFSNNPLGDEGCLAIAAWYGSGASPAVTSLGLSRVGATSSAIKALFGAAESGAPKAITTSEDDDEPTITNLVSLDISVNSFDDAESGSVLRTLLTAASSLKSFVAHHCKIPAPAIAMLGEPIANHSTLTELDLSSNYSCDENGAMWAGVIRNSRSLARVMLTDNQMGTEAVESIVDSLNTSEQHNIIFLQLGGQSKVPPTRNLVSQGMQARLSWALTRNRREDAENKLRGGRPLSKAHSASLITENPRQQQKKQAQAAKQPPQERLPAYQPAPPYAQTPPMAMPGVQMFNQPRGQMITLPSAPPPPGFAAPQQAFQPVTLQPQQIPLAQPQQQVIVLQQAPGGNAPQQIPQGLPQGVQLQQVPQQQQPQRVVRLIDQRTGEETFAVLAAPTGKPEPVVLQQPLAQPMGFQDPSSNSIASPVPSNLQPVQQPQQQPIQTLQMLPPQPQQFAQQPPTSSWPPQ